jgi:putative autoinducer-2 (AI-2) aldolase
MGRNIWQSDYPVAMIKAVRAIIHKNSNVKEANDIFTREKEREQQVVKNAQ